MAKSGYYAYNYLVVALVALLNCPNRNDYNLPLGVLAYLLWNHPYQHSQKHRILWLVLFSLLTDLIWVLAISIS